MREGLRIIVVLVITCVVAGLALAGVQAKTAPIIEQQEIQTLKDGLSKVMDGAASFDSVPAEQMAGAGAAVKNAWQAKDAAGKTVGYVIEAAPSGYGGPIRMLVGVTPENSIKRFFILEALNETPGLGARTTEPAFAEQFTGLKPNIGLAKGRPASGNEIQAVTGATISSRAVLDGVNQALAFASQLNEKR